MTWLFALLSGFILTPTIENVQVSPKEKTVIMQMIDNSKVNDKCSVVWPVGSKKGTIVLALTCVENNQMYKARLGIDYKNQIWMVKRYYPAQWR